MAQADQSPITVYAVFKDIVIPSLSLIATIVIGVIIAIFLKKREEKAKIKGLLVDTYMDYLNKIMAFFNNEIDNFNIQLLKELSTNYRIYFGVNANEHHAYELFKKRIEKLISKVDHVNNDSINWSFYTYRFAFLLGRGNYSKHAQSMEDNITRAFTRDIARNELSEEIINKIMADEELRRQINSSRQHDIEKGISSIELLTAITYNAWQRKLFEPYSNAIADLIDKY